MVPTNTRPSRKWSPPRARVAETKHSRSVSHNVRIFITEPPSATEKPNKPSPPGATAGISVLAGSESFFPKTGVLLGPRVDPLISSSEAVLTKEHGISTSFKVSFWPPTKADLHIVQTSAN